MLPEIVCHARGTEHLHPGVQTIIDVGGQDSKIIAMGEHGTVQMFEMNDRCAAGTGRFFEVLSRRLLSVPMEELGPLALKSTNPVFLSSVCTVFAESEIISHLSAGTPAEDIAMGILESMAKRVVAIGRQARIDYREPIVLTGGIALNVAARPGLRGPARAGGRSSSRTRRCRPRWASLDSARRLARGRRRPLNNGT